MKNIILILTMILFSLGLYGQVTVDCPQDTTLSGFDWDYEPTDFQPVVLGTNNATITYEIHPASNTLCTDNICKIDSIIWTVVADGQIVQCTNLINISTVSLSELIMPDSIVTLQTSSLPVDMSVGINQDISGICNIASSYNDQVIYVDNGEAKVHREWTFLDWCTGIIIKHIITININDVTNYISFGANWYTANGDEANYAGLQYSEDLMECSPQTNNEYPEIQHLYCNTSGNSFLTDPPVLYSDQNYYNGVSTLDLVMIQRHILGISQFEYEWQIIAGDVDDNGYLSAKDLIHLRKLILGIYNQLPNSHSVVGVINENISSFYPFPYIEYTLIKKGDVNGTASNSLQNPSTIDTRANISLSTPDISLVKGQTYMIPLNIDQATDIVGLQTTLQYNPNKIMLSNIQSGIINIDPENINSDKASEGQISLLWMSPEEVSSNTEEALMYLEITAIDNINLSECFQMGSSLTENIIVTAELEEVSPVLKFVNNTSSLISVYPNPTRDLLNIIYTESAQNISFRLSNSNGQLVLEKPLNMNTQIDVSSLPQGLYFYEMINGHEIIKHDKLIIQH